MGEIRLYDFQANIVNSIYREAMAGKKRILVMSPTGSGKTVMAKHIIDNALKKGSRALFTVPKINLIEQTAKYFKDYSILQADDPRFDDRKPLQIAMLQTLINREITPPDIVIFDEVHFAYDGKLIQSVFEKFPDAFFIGLSATPVDESGYLLEGFDAYIDDYQIGDLINMNHLTPVEVYSGLHLDLSEVRVVAGDYVESEVEQVVKKQPVMQSVYDNYVKYASGKKFICFAVNKAHGNALNELFNGNGVRTAFVHSDTPMLERERYYSDFRDGKLQGLINIEILTAGYDETSIECGIMATPTKSWRKYIQSVGRIVRKHEGKERAILLDCGNVIHEHGLPTERKRLIFKPKVSRVIERELGIDDDAEARKNINLSEEQMVFLKKIGSIVDLYDGKVYKKENDLQEDVNTFLKKSGWFWWRQNSGKMYKDGRWVHFASKAGLPDCTLFFNYSSLYVGIELKLKGGTLTENQRATLPEMIQKGVLVYFAESVFDVWLIIKHIEENIVKSTDGVFIKNSIYDIPEKQLIYYKRFKLDKYINR